MSHARVQTFDIPPVRVSLVTSDADRVARGAAIERYLAASRRYMLEALAADKAGWHDTADVFRREAWLWRRAANAERLDPDPQAPR